MIQPDRNDRQFMARAIELARQGWGRTYPNPMVGAVVVENGVVVSEGWHSAAGHAHAEIEAFRALGRNPQPGASLYVTLEPCSTTGRTGACTEAILQSGIQRVVVGTIDPNPVHRGAGLDHLRQAGIEVVEGVLAEDCADMNLLFNHWMSQQTPFLAAKIATTLDGKFCAANGHSKWITGEAARKDVMRWRRYFPAIAASAETILADNPALSSRLPEGHWCPRRFLFDRTLKTLPHAHTLQVFNDAQAEQTTLVCSEHTDISSAQLSNFNIWQLPEKNNHIDLAAFRDRCREEAIQGVYIEPGPRWTSALLAEQSIDYLFHYIAPKYIADTEAPGIGKTRRTSSMNEAYTLAHTRNKSLADDLLVRGSILPAQ